LQTEAQIREAESRDDYGEGYEAAKNRLKDLSAEEAKAGQRTLATEEKLVASAKKSFKEKTAAYKVLNTLEKAYHVTRMVNMAIDMATTIKKAALEVSSKIGSETAQTAAGLNGVLMRMPFMIGEIYGKTIGQLGVFGPPVAAALVALAYGKLGGSGSGSVSTTGLTDEDMNSVAGTGQQYINGQLTNREGGVLGDPTEIADSITSMTEIFSKNLFDIFNSDNSRIVKKLESVRENTDATVKALLGQITGYAGGLTSPFGTIEGTKKEDDPWWRWGPLKSTTTITSVLSSGIQVQGKLGDLINETGDIILRSWENVLVQTKSKFLGVTYDKDSDIVPKYAELDLAFRRSLINALQGFKGSIEEVAISFEGSSERASAIIKDFAFKIETNFKGLNATEALNKFRADLSLNLNLIVKELYPWITEFQKTGEELGETLARLASDSSNLRYGLSLLGIQFKETDLYLRTLAEQDFIKQFGGLEQFGDSINYYVDNFQDLTTKFNDQFGKLNKVFAESGLQVPTTKDKYAELVNSIKVQAETNVDARNKLATLILYSETYNEILEDRIQLEKTLEGLDQALYDLENNTSELTKALREIIKSGFEY
ncbi:MAG: hypothetical protein EBR67_10000, partial [Proteobacteria bacterium]|nr:hypothetical protein [Pseudomonadota bacterium]